MILYGLHLDRKFTRDLLVTEPEFHQGDNLSLTLCKPWRRPIVLMDPNAGIRGYFIEKYAGNPWSAYGLTLAQGRDVRHELFKRTFNGFASCSSGLYRGQYFRATVAQAADHDSSMPRQIA